MKKIIKNLTQIDTVTRYECDGTITITPEEWNNKEEVCEHAQQYKARVSLSKNGKAVIRYQNSAPSEPRYEELYNTRKRNGTGVIVRRTQEHIITTTVTKRFRTPNEIIRDNHDGHLEITAWMKENKGKISD